jgi:hypothetical protein
MKTNVNIVSPYSGGDCSMELLKETLYQPTLSRGGYFYRVERVTHHMADGNNPVTDIKAYYALDGTYIGNRKTAMYLLKKKGIRHFEKRTKTSDGASIGYNPNEKKWYGWSHRAIFGFTIGSTCKIGDAHFNPSNEKEFIESLQDWHSDDPDIIISRAESQFGREGMIVSRKGSKLSTFEAFPKEWGKGKWTARTLEDAKQMAKDFAESVS